MEKIITAWLQTVFCLREREREAHARRALLRPQRYRARVSPRMKAQMFRKRFVAEGVRDRVLRSQLVAVVHVGSLNVAGREYIRRSLAGVGGEVSFAKNSLTARGLEEAGASGLVPLIHGTTALATGPAEVPLAASLLKISKEHPQFLVVGAMVNSSRVLEVTLLAQTLRVPPPTHAFLRPATCAGAAVLCAVQGCGQARQTTGTRSAPFAARVADAALWGAAGAQRGCASRRCAAAASRGTSACCYIMGITAHSLGSWLGCIAGASLNIRRPKRTNMEKKESRPMHVAVGRPLQPTTHPIVWL